MAKLRSTITEVINKYGNLIPQNLKMSIAHEIVERLSSDGVLEDDDTNFIQWQLKLLFLVQVINYT